MFYSVYGAKVNLNSSPWCCKLIDFIKKLLTLSPDLIKPDWMYNLIILISTLVFFMLPMLVISILYLLIGLRLRREKLMATMDANHSFGPGSISKSHRQRLTKRNLQVTKMLCRCHYRTHESLPKVISHWAKVQAEKKSFCEELSYMYAWDLLHFFLSFVFYDVYARDFWMEFQNKSVVNWSNSRKKKTSVQHQTKQRK